MRLPPHFGRTAVIVVALLSAGFFAAYLRFAPYLSGGTSYTDGRTEQTLTDVDALRFALWDTPELLRGSVNTDGSEGRAALTPDGRYLVFTVGEPGLNANLWQAELVDGEPLYPRPLTRLNTAADELSPAFGGNTLYFASNRSGSRGGLDIYQSHYVNGVFGPVTHIAPGLNTAADETDPAPAPGTGRGDGRVQLTFASNRRRGQRTDYDLYVALPYPGPGDTAAGAGAGAAGADAGADTADDADARPAPPPDEDWRIEPFTVLNTPFDERDPIYTADGRGLMFASNRSDGLGDYDLWRSVQNAGLWQPPEPVRGINSAGTERAPLPSADGFSLLFVGAPMDGGTSDIYRARSLELFPLPGRPIGWLDFTVLGLLLLLALLAWLGKRWETLDILYKCLLVSLLVHLGMMLWFREVVVEPETVELNEASPSFKVRIAPSRETMARSVERAGEVQVSRETMAQATAPGRQELRTPEADAAVSEAADLAAASESQELAQPETPSAQTPGRSPADFTRPEPAAEAAVAVNVAQPEASRARRSADAPALAVQASAASSAPAEPSSLTAAARPSREAAPAPSPSTTTQQTASGPARSVLGLPATTTAVPTPGRRQVAAMPTRRPATDGGAQLQLAGPAALPSASESGDSVAAASAPAFEITGLDSAATASRTTPGAPARPSRSWDGTSGEAAHATDGGTNGATGGATGSATGAATAAAAADERPGAASSLLTDGLAGSAASRAAPTTRRSSGAALAPTRRPSAEVAVNSGPSAARDSGSGSGNATDSGVAAAFGSPGAASNAASSRAATADSLLADLALSTGSGRARESGSASARESSRPGLPGRWAATDLPGAGVAASSSDAPAFAPLVIASPGPRSLPTRESERFDNTPYRSRFGEAKLKAIEEYGGSDETEKAVAAGLRYLAQLQTSSGQWGSAADYDEKYGHVAVGKTALCLLAFLGAGHTPESRTEHSGVTEKAIDFLLSVQLDDTGHFGYTTSYSHAITTYALAECYALTAEKRLRKPIENASAWILANQIHLRDSRMFGGWSYYYPDGHTYDRWPRTSITAWQIMALESARLGGIAVPDRAFDDAATFLRATHRRDRGVLLYNHDPDRLRTSYWTLPGSTPAGLFALSLLGEDIQSSTYSTVIDWIMERAPNGFRDRGTDSFVQNATGNLYYWYYGSLAMFRHGGTPWETWNRRLQDTLLPSQEVDGSWVPISTYAEYAGDSRGDRAYTTAMCVLTLEVYYRYFTPLLKVEPGK